MNKLLVEKIYHASVTNAVSISLSADTPVAWAWEENMVKNTILELKYALALNRAGLMLDQIATINEVFGTEL